MGKYAQFVVGPAGAGKSTYCRFMHEYLRMRGRSAHVVNLDPAADELLYTPSADVREVYTVQKAMKSLGLGPNGGTLAVMEALFADSDWLESVFFAEYEDDYLIADLPGQIEFFTHSRCFPRFLEKLTRHGWFVAVIYLLDSSFTADMTRYVAGAAAAMAVTAHLEVPTIGLLSKADLLLDPNTCKRIPRAALSPYIEADVRSPAFDAELAAMPPHQSVIVTALAELLADSGHITFAPLRVTSMRSLREALARIDEVHQWHDQEEPKEPRDDDGEGGDGDGEEVRYGF